MWQRHSGDRRAWDDATREQERLEDELNSWRESEATRQQAWSESVTREQESQRAWDDWIQSMALSPTLSPADMLDLLQRVRLLQERLHARDVLADQLSALRRQIAEWNEDAQTVLALLETGGQHSRRREPDLIEAVAELGRRCSDDGERRRDLIRLDRIPTRTLRSPG